MSNHYEASKHGSRELVAAYNKFGFRLFRELAGVSADTNVLLSPASVAASLALLYHGAGGITQRAIADVLCLGGMDAEALSRDNAILLSAFEDAEARVQITMAMALWIDEQLSFNPAFQVVADKFYKAGTTVVDFNDPGTADIINRWAREKTGGKVEQLLKEEDLGATTDSVLTNAVYFKGLWATPFDQRTTRQGVFHLPGGKQKSVALMSQTIVCPHFEGDAFQAISLDYGDGQFSLYIFLPDENSSLKVFLNKLDTVNWDRWLSEFEDSQVELSLPRFELVGEYDLREVLSQLGMGVAFTASADFSSMGQGQHFISKVKHKVVVEVTEEGTTAAAATAVVMSRSILTPIPFVADRPFFWAIRDNKNSTILFTGVVADPA